MLRQLFAAARSRRQAIDALVRQISEASAAAVEPLVRRRVARMSPCEARGYIRARAGVDIRRRTRAAVAARTDVAMPWEMIAARASERVGGLVQRRLAAESRGAAARSHAA
jgi:hypothetical protein